MTLKEALSGKSQRIIGKVMSDGVAYKLGLRNNPGYGCVVPFLKYGAAAPYNFRALWLRTNRGGVGRILEISTIGRRCCDNTLMRHECNKLTNGVSWAHCSACGLRLHQEGCTTKRHKNLDCHCVYSEEYLIKIGIGSVKEREQILSQFAGKNAGYL